MGDMTSPIVPVRPTCFVISPIGSEGSDIRKNSDQVLRHLIKKSLGAEFDIRRGDEDANPGSITSQIVSSILEADLIVADLTGYNPNVYYEVAIAHGYERPTVHIQRADETPAFDLKDMRLVRYNIQDPDELEKSQRTLRSFAEYAMETPEKVQTPLADAKKFVQIADSQDPVAQSNAEVIDQLRSLRTEVRSAVRGTPTVPRGARNADNFSLRKMIESIADRGALTALDLDSAITQKTSEGFDEWARKLLGRITGEADRDELNRVLFDADVEGALPAEDDLPESAF